MTIMLTIKTIFFKVLFTYMKETLGHTEHRITDVINLKATDVVYRCNYSL